MKFTCTIEINRPLEQVAALFLDDDKRKDWQEGFVSIEPLSGQPGTEGAKSKIIFRTKQGEQELIETITVANPPHEISGLYEHKHMVNTMKNRFRAVGEELTRYDAEVEYTEFRGFMPKLMAFLAPELFRKQVEKYLQQFKVYAEKRD